MYIKTPVSAGVFLFAFRECIAYKKDEGTGAPLFKNAPIDNNTQYAYSHKDDEQRNINNIIKTVNLCNFDYKKVQRNKEYYNR